MVGTRRATSVPVLHALLHSFCCSKTDAASKAERRLVMNYIANCYCEDDRSSANLLDGIRTDGDVYELENGETVSEARPGSSALRSAFGILSAWQLLQGDWTALLSTSMSTAPASLDTYQSAVCRSLRSRLRSCHQQ